jgi:hypothetical protein
MEASPKTGGMLFSNGLTPFDLFCEGKSYGEIVEETGLDLFSVMAEIAKEATAHASFRAVNPYVEQEFQINQLHRVIVNAWERHDDVLNSKGTELAVIVQAIRGISQVLHKGPASVPGSDEKPKMPDGISAETIRQLGDMQVRAMFNKPALQSIDGGLNRQKEPT